MSTVYLCNKFTDHINKFFLESNSFLQIRSIWMWKHLLKLDPKHSRKQDDKKKMFDKSFFIEHQHNLPVHPRRHILITFIAGQSNSTPNKTIRMVSTFNPTINQTKKKSSNFCPRISIHQPLETINFCLICNRSAFVFTWLLSKSVHFPISYYMKW